MTTNTLVPVVDSCIVVKVGCSLAIVWDVAGVIKVFLKDNV